MIFRNRRDAGRRLAPRLGEMSLVRPMVLGLPRGGVPVAAEVANALHAPVEVFVARKVGAPGHEEFGIGAIAEGWDDAVMSDSAALVGVDPTRFAELVRRERIELERRVRLYRGDLSLPPLERRDVILVDDGLATGVTAEAAIVALQRRGPARVILAVPVGAPDTVSRLSAIADQVVAVVAPDGFIAVGSWYEDFSPTSDDEVIAILTAARTSRTEET
jgi:putative phosphoribosyl transferase